MFIQKRKTDSVSQFYFLENMTFVVALCVFGHISSHIPFKQVAVALIQLFT